MATNLTGDIVTAAGNVLVKNANGEWEIANVTSPGVVLTELTDGATFTPPAGSIAHEVFLKGPGDDEFESALYSVPELGASASINIGTEADGTASTFNPAGTGATLTAAAGFKMPAALLESGSKSGAVSYDIDISGWASEGFKAIDFIFSNYTSAENGEGTMFIRVSVDGGSTFRSTAGDYESLDSYSDIQSGTVTEYGNSTAATLIQLGMYVNNVGQDSANRASGMIRFFNPYEDTYHNFIGESSGCEHSNTSFVARTRGTIINGNAIDEVRIFDGADNLSFNYSIVGWY